MDPFARKRALRELGSLAVVSAIAASATAASVVAAGQWRWSFGVVLGMPAFVTAGAWVVMMQSQRRAPLLGMRWGWVLALPLAMAWASFASTLLWLRNGSLHAFARELLRGTYALDLWGPALVYVLLVFGTPLAMARTLAEKGLDHEERGDQIVAFVAFAVGVASALAACVWAPPLTPRPIAFARAGQAAFLAWTTAAIACGGAAAVLAARRVAFRAKLLARIRAGREPAYRIEPTAGGEEIVRQPSASTYRNGARDVVFEAQNEPIVPHQAPLAVVVIVAIALMFGVAIIAVLVDGASSSTSSRPCPPHQTLSPEGFEGRQCVPESRVY